MTTKTETVHAAAFVISDDGEYSYESGTVASGQNLAAGEVIMLSGGNIVTWDGGTASTVIGIMRNPVDASTAAKKGTYLARSAEVRAADLTYPASTLTLLTADLKAINGPIILR